MATKKKIAKAKAKPKTTKGVYLVAWVDDTDPSKEFSTLEAAKAFVFKLIREGDINGSGDPISASKIKIYKVEKVGKITVNITF